MVLRGLPYPMGRIRSRPLLEEPAYWRWQPPTEAEWEWARADHYFKRPVEDEEMVAFRVLVRWCRYRCGICGSSDENNRIVMDHDHKTGLCRGLLCAEHNRLEGLGGGLLFDMYREWPPASVCDLKVGYWPSSVYMASPDLLCFQQDLRNNGWMARGRTMRLRQPWTPGEDRIASRDDLADAEVAEIIGRLPGAVTARRRKLTIGLPDIDNLY